jgi:hypothetical protein
LFAKKGKSGLSQKTVDFFFFFVLVEVVNSHNCKIPGLNPGHDVQPNNFGIFLSIELGFMGKKKSTFNWSNIINPL